jgi:hypothetical protein
MVMFKQLIAVAIAGMLTAGMAYAQTPGASGMPGTGAASGAGAMPSSPSGCEAKAVDKYGKPLVGAAKESFMKKCEKGMKSSAAKKDCETKAVSSKGKPLVGAAKASFVKKCEAMAVK